MRQEMEAKRAVETGSLDGVRGLVTGDGGAERTGTLGLAPSASVLAAAAGAGQLEVIRHLRAACVSRR
jgi:hypothetical protein